MDVVPPRCPLGGAEFVRVGVRRPTIGRALADVAPDTVIHTNVSSAPPCVSGPSAVPGPASFEVPTGRTGGRATVKETNVIGTTQLLAACQKSSSVRRLVVRSSTSVYGGSARDPAVFSESTPPKALPRGGFAKDAVEIEGHVRGFARRRPDVSVCVLRFAHLLGPDTDSPLAGYLGLPVLPTVLGRDPRLRCVHQDDALDLLRLVARRPEPGMAGSGMFNVAGDGMLLLSQIARRLGRPTVPLAPPAVAWCGALLRTLGTGEFSAEQPDMLTRSRVVDTGRLRDQLGFQPRHSTAQTVAAYARGRGAGVLSPELIGRTVDRLAAALLPAGGDLD